MKEPIGFQWLSKLWAKKLYPRYKQLITALGSHYQVYNETLRDIYRLEAENKIFVLRPGKNIPLKNIERNQQKLMELYDLGYANAVAAYPKIQHWMAAAPTSP